MEDEKASSLRKGLGLTIWIYNLLFVYFRSYIAACPLPVLMPPWVRDLTVPNHSSPWTTFTEYSSRRSMLFNQKKKVPCLSTCLALGTSRWKRCWEPQAEQGGLWGGGTIRPSEPSHLQWTKCSKQCLTQHIFQKIILGKQSTVLPLPILKCPSKGQSVSGLSNLIQCLFVYPCTGNTLY